MALTDEREVFIIRMIDGHRMVNLDNSALTWSTRLNKAGAISATVRMAAVGISAAQVRKFTAPKIYGLAVSVGDKILEAGHITGRTYGDGGATLSITAAGLWTYLDWVLLFSPTFNRATGNPRDDSVTISGTTLAGIARQLIRNAADNPTVAENFPPISTTPDGETGDSTRTYYGKDMASVCKRLAELTAVTNGPDQAFFPEFLDSSRQAIRWVHRAGTEANPLLMQAGEPFIFDTTVPRGPVTSLDVDEDGSTIATRVWTNGSQEGQGVTTGANTLLENAGYPLLEVSQDLDVADPAVQQRHTDQALLEASTTTSTWSLSARIDAAAIAPGDFANVYVAGHSAIEDGVHLVRVVGLDGDATQTLKISILPMLTDWDNFDPTRIQRNYLEPDPIRAEAEAQAAANTPSFSSGLGGGGAGKIATIADPWGEYGQARVTFEGSTTPDSKRYRYLDAYIPTPTDLVALGAFGTDGELIILGRIAGAPVDPGGDAFPDAYLHRTLTSGAPTSDLPYGIAEPDDKGHTWNGLYVPFTNGEFIVSDPGTYEIEAQLTYPPFTSQQPFMDDYGRTWRAIFMKSISADGNSWVENYHGPHRESENNSQTVSLSDAPASAPLTQYFKTTRVYQGGEKFMIGANWNDLGMAGFTISPESSFLKIRRIA